jgi:Fur family transcriptional regulator, ferric uptake regulator
MRQTKTRKKLLALLTSARRPISVADLLSHLSVNKTTVYRQLDSLVKAGQVTEVRFSDRKVRYELASLPHHHHLVCTACDSVRDIDLPDDIESIASKFPNRDGFVIQNHYLEFFGLCAKCSRHE